MGGPASQGSSTCMSNSTGQLRITYFIFTVNFVLLSNDRNKLNFCFRKQLCMVCSRSTTYFFTMQGVVRQILNIPQKGTLPVTNIPMVNDGGLSLVLYLTLPGNLIPTNKLSERFLSLYYPVHPLST